MLRNGMGIRSVKRAPNNSKDSVLCSYLAKPGLTAIKAVKQNWSVVVTRMWANAQPDGRPAEHRWRPLVNAAKFG